MTVSIISICLADSKRHVTATVNLSPTLSLCGLNHRKSYVLSHLETPLWSCICSMHHCHCRHCGRFMMKCNLCNKISMDHTMNLKTLMKDLLVLLPASQRRVTFERPESQLKVFWDQRFHEIIPKCLKISWYSRISGCWFSDCFSCFGFLAIFQAVELFTKASEKEKMRNISETTFECIYTYNYIIIYV